MKSKVTRQQPFNAGDYERKRLDVDLIWVLAIAILLTLAIYGLVLPFRSSYLGILLYERGFTQYIVISFSCLVIGLIIIKFIKLQIEKQALRKLWLPETIFFNQPNSRDLLNLQRNLAKNGSLIAIRCSRIISAYIHSKSRKAATELALDDSAFYQSASDSSYTIPRILVWAIPLLGFIGTVVGISSAVNGFSGFLEQTADVEQIKAGIGTVTSGLAVAFDTTLLALFLSVLVMIPLVFVERMESRLLLSMDVFINDHLLSRFGVESESLDENTLNQAINTAIKEAFPSPEKLIEPAHEYAQKAVEELLKSFVGEIESLQTMGHDLADKIQQVYQFSLADRESFIHSLETQQKAYENLVTQLHTISEEIQARQGEITQGFYHQSERLSTQLEQAINQLDRRITDFTNATDKLSEITQLKASLDQLILSLNHTDKMNQSLQDLQEKIVLLKPSLEKLSKPRMITFVEPEDEII